MILCVWVFCVHIYISVYHAHANTFTGQKMSSYSKALELQMAASLHVSAEDQTWVF